MNGVQFYYQMSHKHICCPIKHQAQIARWHTRDTHTHYILSFCQIFKHIHCAKESAGANSLFFVSFPFHGHI
jgi:hypothetical protein